MESTGVPLGPGCLCHPYGDSFREMEVAQAVDFFREERAEPCPAPHPPAGGPTSLELCGVALRSEVVGGLSVP